MATESINLLQGTLDLLVLKTLAPGAMHGYAISRSIHERTDGVLDVDDAALYQGLHRMERKGWLAHEWGLSENNRRAKYYSLTQTGRRQLREQTATWRRYASAVFSVLDPVTEAG